MQELDLQAKELQRLALGDESKLDEAAKELKKSTKQDIEEDFSLERWNDFMRDRKAIVSGQVSPLKTDISEAQKAWKKVQEREQDGDFQDDRRINRISNEDYNRLRKAAKSFQRAYQKAVGLFYLENRVNDKVSSVVDLQRSRQSQKEQLELMKDTFPQVVTETFRDLEPIKDLEKEVEEKEERIKELEDKVEKKQELASRLDKLEGRIQGMDAGNTEKHAGTDQDSSENGDGLQEVGTDRIIEELELTGFQEEMLNAIEEVGPDEEALSEELGRPPGIFKSVATGLVNDLMEKGLKSENLDTLAEEEG